jgi:DNA replication protein DnaC
MSSNPFENQRPKLTLEEARELLAKRQYDVIDSIARRETEWGHARPVGDITAFEIADELKVKVGRKEIPCPVCHDYRRIPAIRYGKTTGVLEGTNLPCRCARLIRFYTEFDANIPAKYRHLNPHTYTPVDPKTVKGLYMPQKYQEKQWKAIMNNPFTGYAFFGPAGWCKTTFSVMLFYLALERATPYLIDDHFQRIKFLWRTDAKTIGDQHHAFQMQFTKLNELGQEEAVVNEPDVTVDRILRAAKKGLPVGLFLEEIDKVKPTDFKRNLLFEIINTLYENNGQLVLCSNSKFSEFRERLGPEFARRVIEMCTVQDNFKLSEKSISHKADVVVE